MRAPEEVYKAQQGGAPRAAEELTREERSAARQKRKRAGKKQKAHQVGLCLVCRDSQVLCSSILHKHDALMNALDVIAKIAAVLVVNHLGKTPNLTASWLVLCCNQACIWTIAAVILRTNKSSLLSSHAQMYYTLQQCWQSQDGFRMSPCLDVLNTQNNGTYNDC